MRRSNIQQAEIYQNQDLIMYSMSNVIQSFHPNIAHGPKSPGRSRGEYSPIFTSLRRIIVLV